jgi:type 1 glutamine amidotransferase
MMIKVLLVTDGIFHPPFLARKALHQTLAKMVGFEFQHIRSMENLPKNLMDYAALVIYIHHKNISETALTALNRFVSNGGGVLAIHSATASFKQQSQYFEILGVRFIGHDKVKPFIVNPVMGSEIFDGIQSFTLKDELYIHELQAGITVHLTSKHEGQDIPVVWTHQYGQGRVCQVVPGHRPATMNNENMKKVLQRGLMWVCGI